MPGRTEELASDALGQVKKAKAAIEGVSGVFKKLMEEHGQVTALLMRVKISSDPGIRRELFPTIRKELLAHERGELREVYPVLKQHAETASLARDHDHEAAQLEQAIEQLHVTAVEDPGWGAKFEQLVELIQHHTQEEENDYFPAAQQVLGDVQAKALQARYERTKAEITKQLG